MPPKRKVPDASSVDQPPTKRVTRATAALIVTQPSALASQQPPTKRRGRPPGIPANIASSTMVRMYGKKRIRSTRSPATSSLKENYQDSNDERDPSDTLVLNRGPENQMPNGSEGNKRKRSQRVTFGADVVTKSQKGLPAQKQPTPEANSSRAVARMTSRHSASDTIITVVETDTSRTEVVHEHPFQRPFLKGSKSIDPSSSTPHISPTKTRSSIKLPRILPSSLYSHFTSQIDVCLSALQDPSFVKVDDERDVNDFAYRHLSDLLTGTIERGEGNSCLVIGPSGSGKTRIFEQAIKKVSQKCVIVRLSGFVQQNDRLAMREIARQVLEQTGSAKFSELPTGDDENPFLDDAQDPSVTQSLPPSSHLPSLIASLSSLSRPVIILLDGFHLFTGHARQALLYCLLDTVQSCRTGAEGQKGLAVIGLTSRVDVVNLLEKRVKSRFSHRLLRTAGVESVDGWISILKQCLTERLDCSDNEISSLQQWIAYWEHSVDQFLNDRTLRDSLRDLFGLTRDLRTLLKAMSGAVASLTPSEPFLLPTSLQAHLHTQQEPLRFVTLSKLNYPLISLIIAAEHVRISGHDAFSFEMIYDLFRTQVRTSSAAPVVLGGSSIGMVNVSRGIMMGAFEQLVAMKFFVATMAPSAGVSKEFLKHRTVVEREDLRLAVDRMGQTNLKKWFPKAQ